MEKIVISVEDMANILKDAFENYPDVVSDEYCKTCNEMHDGHCPVPDFTECPHEKIVEYRFFVRTFFRKYIVRS